MNRRRLLLCTDMDRTVIPNGEQPEHPGARERFRAFCLNPEVLLVYVTGRHQALVKEALDDYALPQPDYVITDVGTKIYRTDPTGWRELPGWESRLNAIWNGVGPETIKNLLCDIDALVLQEDDRQNTHKLSYYLPLSIDKDVVLPRVEQRLQQANISVDLIWSIDEHKQVGLLDLIPHQASKLDAIEFLQAHLHYTLEEVIFAGDSGNDMPVLCSRIHSVLVANASDEVKGQASELARSNGYADALYIAEPHHQDLSGNYADGVLQGVWHYAPDLHRLLTQAVQANE